MEDLTWKEGEAASASTADAEHCQPVQGLLQGEKWPVRPTWNYPTRGGEQRFRPHRRHKRSGGREKKTENNRNEKSRHPHKRVRVPLALPWAGDLGQFPYQ